MRSVPRFELQSESRRGASTEDLQAAAAWVPRTSEASSLGSAGSGAFRRGFGFLASLLAHVGALALLFHLNVAARVPPYSAASIEPPETTTVYLDLRVLKELKILRALPVVRSSASGGAPGAPSRPKRTLQPALQASSVSHPSLTIIVNPLKPDNTRQAIHQAMAPPDLRITVEQQVPDIVQVDDPTLPKPQVDMALRRPTAPETAAFTSAATAPTIDAKAPELAVKLTSSVEQPKMPVSYFAPDSMQAPHERIAASGRKPSTTNPSADPSGSIVVMSVDPATFSQLTTLAQGNRYAAIAIAPSKEGAGSAGGKLNGGAASGPGGIVAGGDLSIGTGTGKSGGAGGTSQAAEVARLSAVGGSGTTGGVDANRLLSPVVPATIFPVIIPPKLRRAPMVISAGPIGGGGLDVYGALNCGKVYSIFLPMPGKNWVLQYCAHEPAAPAKSETPAAAGVIRMQPGLIPPSPQEQFDFRRLPVADKDGDKLIIVQTTIDKTGSVSNARLFQGVLPTMDAAAVQAVSKWKFEPATRAGSAIDVDALVGIPARLPPETSAASSSALKTQKN